MKKILLLLSTLMGIICFSSIANASLKPDANTNDLVAYINSTKYGKDMPITKASYTQNNYLVLFLKNKPKIKSQTQRERLSYTFQQINNRIPKKLLKSGVAFYQGDKNGDNLIVAFSKKKIAQKNYYNRVKEEDVGDFGTGSTAYYVEPIYGNEADGMVQSGPDTQGPTYGPDKETLIEMIQDVTE